MHIAAETLACIVAVAFAYVVTVAFARLSGGLLGLVRPQLWVAGGAGWPAGWLASGQLVGRGVEMVFRDTNCRFCFSPRCNSRDSLPLLPLVPPCALAVALHTGSTGVASNALIKVVKQHARTRRVGPCKKHSGKLLQETLKSGRWAKGSLPPPLLLLLPACHLASASPCTRHCH